MWILSFLPDWIFHIILLVGVLGLIAGFLSGFIPLVNKYALPIQLVSLLMFSIGLYAAGGLENNKKWKAQVEEMDLKIKAAETKSEEANSKIEIKVIEKTKTIRDKGDAIITYIDREVVKDKEIIKFVENCPIPDILVNTHNAAALNTLIKEKK